MKKLILIIMLCAIAILPAQVIGKLGLTTGVVKYKEKANSQYEDVKPNMLIHKDGYLSLDLGSKAKLISYEGGEKEVTGRREIRINDVYEEMKKPKSLGGKMLARLRNLNTFSNERAKNEAGIRRDEAKLGKDEIYIWDEIQYVSLDEAIRLYESQDYVAAVESLEAVIEQDPLASDAEIAHAYLIVIYSDHLKDNGKLQKHLNFLKQDFPASEFLKD